MASSGLPQPQFDPYGRIKRYKLSRLAKIYGRISEDPLNGHSGYTPTKLKQGQRPGIYVRKKEKIAFQRQQFRGWSSSELKALDAFAHYYNGDFSRSELHNEIHPMFRMERWVKRDEMRLDSAPWKIGNGKEGYYEASNPIVWKELEPILRMASRMLENADLSLWWDALLFGEHRRIDPGEADPDKMRNTFHQRPPQTAHSARKELDAKILGYVPYVRFELISGSVQVPTFLFDPDASRFYGCCQYQARRTRQNPSWDGRLNAIIRISLQKIDALLNKNLNTAERLLLQYRVARTILHELAHASYMLMRHAPNGTEITQFTRKEPYFEDEVVAELGRSMEDAVFRVQEELGVQLPLGVLQRDWPSCDDMVTADNDKNYRGTAMGKYVAKYTYPVSMKYFEHIWQDEFWNSYVRQFSAGSLKVWVRFSRMAGGKVQRLTNDPLIPAKPTASITMIEQERELNYNMTRQALQATMGDLKTLESLWNRVQMPDIMVPGAPEEGAESDEEDWNVGNDSDFEWDIPNPPEPPAYRKIFIIVHKYRLILAFESMKMRRPAHLILEYINRRRDLDGQEHVGRDDWHAFLAYTSSRGELFAYDTHRDHPEASFGGEDMTYIPQGWDGTIQAIPPPPLPPIGGAAQEATLKDEVLKFQAFYRDPNYQISSFNRDYETILIHSIHNSVRRMTNLPDLSEDWFLNVVARCSQDWVVLGPGIMRWIG